MLYNGSNLRKALKSSVGRAMIVMCSDIHINPGLLLERIFDFLVASIQFLFVLPLLSLKLKSDKRKVI